MSMWKATVLLATVFLFVPRMSGVCAQESEPDVTLEEVVVTAARAEQSIEKVPANVTVIDEKDIKNSNAKTVVDLLRSDEGIVVRGLLGNGKRSEVDLRGFGETGPYNALVLVDGRRVNEIDLSGVDWTQIPLDQVERKASGATGSAGAGGSGESSPRPLPIPPNKLPSDQAMLVSRLWLEYP